MHIRSFFLLLGLFVFASGSARAESPVGVAVSNYPLAYFAQRIGGDAAEVSFPAPAGIDPAFWRPRPQDVLAMQSADVIFLNGAGYEHWRERVSLPAGRIVDTSEAFSERFLEIESGPSHSHGKAGEHSHRGTAFVTWLDLRQALEQASAVRDALVRESPDDEELFRSNYDDLAREFSKLDEQMQTAFAPYGKRALLASHPVYQYLARRYGLDLESVVWEPGALPSNEQWSALERSLEARPADLMLWEAAPLSQTVTRLKALGVDVVVFEPAGNRPTEGDFLATMRRNLANVQAAVEPQS